jgi:alkylation response protein AidB-like acyl-CoA dehydrogenase
LITAASASKLYSTELAQKLANYATEIMRLYGQLEEDPHAPMDGSMSELYQMCKGATIYAGTVNCAVAQSCFGSYFCYTARAF